jgi:DNA-3-methyladenine glycosylase II
LRFLGVQEMNESISEKFRVGVEFLKLKDEVFREIENDLDPISFELRNLNFTAFCKIVIGQQLSSKAASTIFNRFLITLGSSHVEANQVINLKIEQFKEVGISIGKSRYLKNFANIINENPLYFDQLNSASSHDAYKSLIAVDGVGPWTANIIQLFYLGDLDVFPFGDASLEKVYSRLYQTRLTVKQKLSYDHVNWASPYRGVLALHLWEYLDSGLFKQLD